MQSAKVLKVLVLQAPARVLYDLYCDMSAHCQATSR
jgi:hypothetical protein